MDLQYLMIIEKGENNYSAYLPDLPGCVATGKTLAEVKENLSLALKMHLDGLKEDGEVIPEPSAQYDYLIAS